VATPNLSRDARDVIQGLQLKHARQVLLKILDLCGDTEPNDSKPLKGAANYRRVDSGEYRIIYRVDNDELFIHTIGKRNDDDVYKQFERKPK
jgi:mRNA interferase RelE/StbE